MKNTPVIALQSLESRTLFSAGVHHHVSTSVTPNASAIQADLQKLGTDFQQFLSDRASWMSVYLADRAMLAADKSTVSGNLDALKATLQSDQQKSDAALAADKAALMAAYNADQPAIVQDRANIKADMEAGNTSQLSTDQAQLNTDHAKAEADVHPLYLQFQTDQQTWKTTIFNDKQAIKNASQSNSQQYITDLTKCRADLKQWAATLKADRQAIAGDEKQLTADGYVEASGDFGGDSNGGNTNTNTHTTTNTSDNKGGDSSGTHQK